MVNHKLFFAICLTTLLYNIGCPVQAVGEKSNVGEPQTNIEASSESGNNNGSTTTSTTKPLTKPPTPPQPITTTAASTTSTLTPNVTTERPTSTPQPSPITTAPPPKPTPTPQPHDRSFDLPSFIGGVILSLGVAAIGYVVYKFYKTRTDPNYRTL